MNDSSILDEVVTDSMTTDELLQSIEYNTRMVNLGVSHIFVTGLVILAIVFLYLIMKRFYFSQY